MSCLEMEETNHTGTLANRLFEADCHLPENHLEAMKTAFFRDMTGL